MSDAPESDAGSDTTATGGPADAGPDTTATGVSGTVPEAGPGGAPGGSRPGPPPATPRPNNGTRHR